MSDLGLCSVMGAEGYGALEAARGFLAATPGAELLRGVGAPVFSVPEARHPAKRWFQASYGRAAEPSGEDLLAGLGLFYVAENRRLYLDCTAGHYQMTWGYAHPELQALAIEAMQHGIVWDNHSNIPQAPVKQLAARLVEIANCGVGSVECQVPDQGPSGCHPQASSLEGVPVSCPPPSPSTEAVEGGTHRSLPLRTRHLDTALLGICTGSVACAAAIKIALLHYAKEKKGRGSPAFIVLDGNYHGTDLFAQRLRGMWPEYFTNVEVAAVQPNAPEELEAAFARLGERVAAFWAEPVMMNREAIAVEPEYLQLARRLCHNAGALMAIDEIQTGFWFPEVMMFRRLGIVPDLLVLGKGMTAGFHPLSALLYNSRLDCLAQYDAISTNGNAALAAVVGLGCIALIERHAAEIGRVGERYHGRMAALCEEFPELLAEVRGAGHMSGLKFRRREDALGFHRAALERGLWVRAHAYHEGHSAVLTKFALPLGDAVADFAVNAFRQLLEDCPWRKA